MLMSQIFTASSGEQCIWERYSVAAFRSPGEIVQLLFFYD